MLEECTHICANGRKFRQPANAVSPAVPPSHPLTPHAAAALEALRATLQRSPGNSTLSATRC
jgi:hypothetical protein